MAPRISTDTIRRALDVIDDTDDDLSVEGSRRRGRRAKRRAARRARRSQRKENRRTWRAGKKDGRQDRRDRKVEARLARRQEHVVTQDEANPERARRRAALPQDQQQQEPEEADWQEELDFDEGTFLPEEELEEVLDEDAEDIADVADDMSEQEILAGARRHLRKLRQDALSGDISGKQVVEEVGRMRRGTSAALRRHGQGGDARRLAIKRRMKQRLLDETAGFSGDVGCAACTEAYRQARLAGVALAQQQVESELGRDELGFVKKAAKSVGRGLSNLAQKLKRDPTKVAERRERRAGQAAQVAIQRAERKHGRQAGLPGAWGPDVQIAPDLVMRTVDGRQGAVMQLGDGLWLIASLPSGQAQADPQGTRRKMLRQGQEAIGSKLGPMQGLLQLTG